jgi:protein TonB
MDWCTRLFGMCGVTLVALLILGGALFTWTTYQAAETRPKLSVFNVALPAAPPESQSEIPPGLEQEQKKKSQPKPLQPKIEPPEIRIVSDNPIGRPAATARTGAEQRHTDMGRAGVGSLEQG